MRSSLRENYLRLNQIWRLKNGKRRFSELCHTAQIVNDVVVAFVNELTAAAPVDEPASDVELHEGRLRIKLRRVFDAALAERAAQVILHEEDAAPKSPAASPAAKVRKKGRHEK